MADHSVIRRLYVLIFQSIGFRAVVDLHQELFSSRFPDVPCSDLSKAIGSTFNEKSFSSYDRGYEEEWLKEER